MEVHEHCINVNEIFSKKVNMICLDKSTKYDVGKQIYSEHMTSCTLQ